MRRLRWLLLVCAPALLLVLVRLGLGQATEAAPHGRDELAGRTPQQLDMARPRASSAMLPPRSSEADDAPAEHAVGRDDAPDPWALPESDPRRGLVDAFRGMTDDTTPAEAEQRYVAALERGGFSGDGWTATARAAAEIWFAGLDARVTCYAGGCAASLAAADAGALADARQRIAQQAPQAAWQGPVITAPAVAEPDGRQRQLWIFVRPE